MMGVCVLTTGGAIRKVYSENTGSVSNFDSTTRCTQSVSFAWIRNSVGSSGTDM